MHDISVLTQMAFILAAAFAGGLLLQRFRQPVMLGYIVVGIVLGPHGLGLIHEGEELRLLAELGILLLLFIIGLELDLHKFIPVYKISLATAGCQIAAAFIAMIGLSFIWQWPMEQIVVLAFALSLSSTAVTIKLLEDMRALNTGVGNVAVGVLIAQDLAVIPMILVISAFGTADVNMAEKLAMPTLLIAATIAVVWIMVRRPQWVAVLAPVFRWLERDRQKALTGIMLCFTAAAVAGGLGFSSTYGAFVAGLLLGNSAYGHAYERQVRPLFDILMMVFFLSVGMLIDFHYLAENIWTVLLLLFVVMLLKTVINIGILRVLGLSKRNASFVGSSLGQIGEFSFALAALGLSKGAIESDVYKLIVVVIALSLLATPAWIHFMRRVRVMKRGSRKTRRMFRSNIETFGQG